MSAFVSALVPGESSYFVEFGAVAQAVVKAAPGRVFSVSALNYAGAAKFLQLHDLAGVIPVNAVARVTWTVAPGLTVIVGSEFFGPPLAASPLLGGMPFATGIAWGWSTSLAQYVAAPLLSGLTQIVYA
jgi:hypothetical protein